MARDELTLVHVLEQLQRIASSTGSRYDVDAMKQGKEYLRLFREAKLTPAQVIDAVDHGMKSWTTFPAAPVIVNLARSRRFIHRQPEPLGNECRDCHAQFFCAGFESQLAVGLRVRCLCPRPEPGWWTPAALACVEFDERMPKAPADYATNPMYRTGRAEPAPDLFDR